MSKQVISTDSAPSAIGTYSQAVKVGSTVYLSGQIPLIPESMEMVTSGFADEAHQVFKNLAAVCEATGGSLNDLAKVNIYLTDLENFAQVNEIMSQYFAKPYPARAAIGINQLPKGAQIEIDGVMEIPGIN